MTRVKKLVNSSLWSLRKREPRRLLHYPQSNVHKKRSYFHFPRHSHLQTGKMKLLYRLATFYSQMSKLIRGLKSPAIIWIRRWIFIPQTTLRWPYPLHTLFCNLRTCGTTTKSRSPDIEHLIVQFANAIYSPFSDLPSSILRGGFSPRPILCITNKTIISIPYFVLRFPPSSLKRISNS